MKIAVIGANGKAGQLIAKEAVERGLDTTAIVRNKNKSATQSVIQKDLFDLTIDDIKNFNVIIDAFGGWTEEALPQHSTSLKKLCDLLSNSQVRLLIVGGAGSLYTDKQHTTAISDAPDFPDSFKPVAFAMAKSLKELRQRNDVNWTYISPAADFQATGTKTGKYILAGEEFTLNSKGESFISYSDYAIAMIDEALKGKHIQQRISVLSE